MELMDKGLPSSDRPATHRPNLGQVPLEPGRAIHASGREQGRVVIHIRMKWSHYFAFSLFSILLAACGGSEGHLPAQGGPAGSAALYTIGGTVTGVSTGSFITLANNGADDIVLGGDGTFTFPTKLASGSAYNLSIVTLPVNQPCTQTFGAGAVAGANVDLLNVICGLPPSGLTIGTGNLIAARDSHTATLLPNGKVLVAGGFDGSGSLASAELYDPVTETWSATGSLATARDFHAFHFVDYREGTGNRGI